jgi:hypothetical protein
MPESLEPIRREIKNYLTKPYPQVMAIKGKWGIGKTYTWKKLIVDIGKSNVLYFKKYSYISLFGVQSIDDIYSSIFVKTVDSSNVIDNPTLGSLWSNVLSLKDGRREALSLIGKIKNITSINEYYKNAASLAVRETIVCIDDLERRSDSLKLKDLMGLVSQLKEQRNCKVMLILNEDVFNDSDREEFRLFAEKVIDVQIIFDLNPEECIGIVVDNKKWYFNYIKSIAVKLNIKNIRLLQRVIFIIDEVCRQLNLSNVEIQRNIVLAACVFVWCHYSKEAQTPNIDFVKSYDKISFKTKEYLKIRKNEFDENVKIYSEWAETLNSIDYISTNGIDLAVADYVLSGILDQYQLRDQIEQFEEQQRRSKINQKFDIIWRKIWDSLSDNQAEIRALMIEYFEKYTEYVDLNQLDVSVGILRMMGFDNEANYLVDTVIGKRGNEWGKSEVSKRQDHLRREDQYLASALEKYIVLNEPEITLKSALTNIYENQIATDSELDFLAQLQPEEFYKLFKESSPDDIRIFIDASLLYNKKTNANEKAQSLVRNAANALRSISQEHPLNLHRVSYYFNKYGIEL